MEYNYMSFLTDFCFMSLLLVIAQFMRAKIKFLQMFYIPASLVAGILGLLLGPQFLDLIPWSGQIGSYAYMLVCVLFGGLFLGKKEKTSDFYTDHVLKEINGGIQSSVDADSGEEFPTPMSTAIGESFIRFNVEDLLPKIAPRAVFVGHGYYNELHQRVEAEEAYRLANEPKQLYYVDGKHNEWMFDEDPKFQALAAALADFYKEHLKPMEFGLQK